MNDEPSSASDTNLPKNEKIVDRTYPTSNRDNRFGHENAVEDEEAERKQNFERKIDLTSKHPNRRFETESKDFNSLNSVRLSLEYGSKIM